MSQTGVHEGESRAESDVTLESCVKIIIEDLQVPTSPPLNVSLAVLGTLGQHLVFLTVVALQLLPHAEGRRRRELCSPIKELLPFESSKTGGSTKRVWVNRSVKEKLDNMFGVKRGLTVDSGGRTVCTQSLG